MMPAIFAVHGKPVFIYILMESLVVHPKNQMELNALKATLKEMGIRFEKFHTRGAARPQQDSRPAPKTNRKPKTGDS